METAKQENNEQDKPKFKFANDTLAQCANTPATKLAIATSPEIKFDVAVNIKGSLPLANPKPLNLHN